MKRHLLLPAIVIMVLGAALSASASSYIGLGASYRSFSSDPLWVAPNWQENLKGSIFLSLGAMPGVRVNMASYIGYGGVEALPEEMEPVPPPVISLTARAGVDYDLVKYDKEGTYFGFGPTAGMSYGNVSFGNTSGKVDFNIGAQAFLSVLSGKLEIDGNVSYTFRDVFVNGGLMVRYNPVGPLIIFASMDYLRRDGFVSLGAGLKF